MAISAAVALMSTATTYLTVGFVTTQAMITHFLVTTAMGAALKALTPTPSLGGANAANRGYQVTQRGAATDHQVIYGQTRVGGVVVFDATSGDENKYLHRVVAFAGHEIEEFTTFYLNDVAVTLSGSDVTNEEFQIKDDDGNFEEYAITINTHLGTDDQTADTDLVNADVGWTANHRLRGIAYAYFKFKYDADVFPNGIPDISAVIKGKKVYDPRTSTTAWSDNPALCLRDYITSSYGLKEETDNIDDTLVSTAANVCDYYNYPTLTGDPRFTLNGAFLVSATPHDVMTDLSTSMGGMLWYSQGKWRMKPAYYTNPVLSLDEDDLRSSISVSTRHSRRDNFNTVKGVFRGPDTNYQPTDYTPVTDADFLVADNNQESVLNLDLPYTDDFHIARRLALITLERNRQQITVQASFGLKAFRCQVGDIIQLTNSRFGWTNKQFEIISWSFGLQDQYDLQVHLTMRETSANVFDDISDGAVLELDNTGLDDPFITQVVTLNTPVASTKLNADGTTIPIITFSWSVTNPSLVEYYEFQWKTAGESTYNSRLLKDTQFVLAPALSNEDYSYRVRTVSPLGVKSDWTTAGSAFSTVDDTTPPSLPTDISADGGFKYITISWTNPPEKDLNYVEVYENNTNTTVGATKVGVSGSDSFTRTNLGLSQTKWYFLKSVDYSGNASAFTTGVSAQTTYLDDPDFENGVRQLFIDQGLDIIEPVSSFPAAGDFTGQQVFLTTDGKLYYWTGSQWDTVVSEVGTIDFSDLQGQLADAQVAVNAINGTKITDNTITSSEIAARTIQAGNIVSNTIGANEIASNAITANEIAANTITASEINGNTITANEIAANTITGGLLATSGIITSAAQINSAVIETAKIKDLNVERAKIGNLAAMEVDAFDTSNLSMSNTTAENNYGWEPVLASHYLDHDGNTSTTADAIVNVYYQPIGTFSGDETTEFDTFIQIQNSSGNWFTYKSKQITVNGQPTTGLGYTITYPIPYYLTNANLRVLSGIRIQGYGTTSSGNRGMQATGVLMVRYR